MRRRLGHLLTEHRERAGLTAAQVQRATGITRSSLSRYEAAKTAPDVQTLATLLRLYKVPPGLAEGALEMARQAASGKGWWRGYGGVSVPDWLVTFVALESEATTIDQYHCMIPGLFHSEPYMRALMAADPMLPDDEIDQRVELRMKRQARVFEDRQPQVRAIIDEGALRRQVSADPAVLPGQIDRLLEIADLPHVSLQILCLDDGRAGAAAAGVGSGFVMLGYDDDEPTVYLEDHGVGHHLEGWEHTERFRMAFGWLSRVALTPERTVRLLRDRASTA